jgi:hypothetical protein
LREKKQSFNNKLVKSPIELNLSSDEKIYMQKLNDSDKNIIKKNNIIQERLRAVDKILDMYPFLKKDRTQIVDTILDNKCTKVNNYVLEKFIHNNLPYYRDPIGNIINENVVLVGVYLTNDSSNSNLYNYYFFDEIITSF